LIVTADSIERIGCFDKKGADRGCTCSWRLPVDGVWRITPYHKLFQQGKQSDIFVRLSYL
jgi:hypothetical protein